MSLTVAANNKRTRSAYASVRFMRASVLFFGSLLIFAIGKNYILLIVIIIVFVIFVAISIRLGTGTAYVTKD